MCIRDSFYFLPSLPPSLSLSPLSLLSSSLISPIFLPSCRLHLIIRLLPSLSPISSPPVFLLTSHLSLSLSRLLSLPFQSPMFFASYLLVYFSLVFLPFPPFLSASSALFFLSLSLYLSISLANPSSLLPPPSSFCRFHFPFALLPPPSPICSVPAPHHAPSRPNLLFRLGAE